MTDVEIVERLGCVIKLAVQVLDNPMATARGELSTTPKTAILSNKPTSKLLKLPKVTSTGGPMDQSSDMAGSMIGRMQ